MRNATSTLCYPHLQAFGGRNSCERDPPTFRSAPRHQSRSDHQQLAANSEPDSPQQLSLFVPQISRNDTKSLDLTTRRKSPICSQLYGDDSPTYRPTHPIVSSK